MYSRRQYIIDHLNTLRRDSPRQVSIANLARVSGISRSSLYKYYPDILQMLREQPSTTEYLSVKRGEQKQDMLRNQLSKHKEMINCLSNICSNQLLEIADLTERITHLERTSQAKIAYLQSQLVNAIRKPLETVK